MSHPKQIPALDGVRGMAILSVMLLHSNEAFEGTGAIERVFYYTFALGWIGVDLFFVLSGFLITRNLLSSKGTAHYFRNFYMRRALRIFPLYYSSFIGFCYVLPLFSAWNASDIAYYREHSTWWWLFSSNMLSARDSSEGFLYHFWSVAVEEQFYFLWPLLILLTPAKHFVRACVTLTLIAIAFRGGLLAAGYNTHFIHNLLPARFDAFSMGGLLAAHSLRGDLKSPPLLRWALWCIPLVILSFPLQTLYAPVSKVRHTLYFTGLAGIFGLLIQHAQISGSFVQRFTRFSVLRFFGKYSYSLYLFHTIIRDLLPISRPGLIELLGSPVLAGLVYFVIVSTFALGVSMVTWEVLEKPLLGLKRYFEVPAPPDQAATTIGTRHHYR